MQKIALFLLPKALTDRLTYPLLGIGHLITRYVPNLEYDLREIQGPDAQEYSVTALLNALFWSLLLGTIVAIALLARRSITAALFSQAFQASSAMAVLLSRVYPVFVVLAISFFTMFLFFLYYPRILSRKLADTVDRDLVFALKDLLLQLGSGVTLFNALINVSQSGYGAVSRQFEVAVKEINAGETIDHALENMAARTESEYMRRAVWQMVTALRGGASIEGALESVIEVLRLQQAASIKRFSGELNLWALVFLIFAVAVPGLGSTVLIVISAFGGIQVSETTYMTILAMCFVMQIIIVGFVKARRPSVQI